MSDRIQKTIDLNAPIERVWRALTDHQEFSQWFRVALDAPFAVDELSRGHMTYLGYEHLVWEARVVEMSPPHRFAFTWHPYAVDTTDYSDEPPTRVQFTLEAIGQGTRLAIVESGFDALPDNRREVALRMNTGGWDTQARNIQAHVES